MRATMDAMILVTGATGTLGRDLVPLLRRRGADVATLSRASGDGHRVADLETGSGLSAALDGNSTVVHLAAGRDQQLETRTLVEAARAADVGHVVFISIAGIDEIPFPYYVQKRAAEKVVEQSGLPFSSFRTTQFHPFVVSTFFAPQRRLPVLFTPRLSVQPIDTIVVSEVLADLALGEPQGRIADLGGPEVLTGVELARAYTSKPVIPFSLLGRTWAGYKTGHHLVPHNLAGGRTFAEYLAAQPE